MFFASRHRPSFGLRYDISTYSGGIGVVDKMAIWSRLVSGLEGLSPDALAADPAYGDDFRWMLTGHEGSFEIRAAGVA
jgi:hypothetical protein